MLTPRQLATLHCAVKSLGLNDAQYRIILTNVADVASSKALTNAGFEDVMAVLEDRGHQLPDDPTRWRDKVGRRGTLPGERMLHKIHHLAAGQPYPLGALVRRFSGGAHDQAHKLRPQQAYALVEALKEIHERQKKEGEAPAAAGHPERGEGSLFGDSPPPPAAPRRPPAHRRTRVKDSTPVTPQGSAAHAPDPHFAEEPF